MQNMCLMLSTWKVQSDKTRSAVKTPISPTGHLAKQISWVLTHKLSLVTVILLAFILEQLTVFYTSGLALALSSVLQVLSLDLHHDGIMSITCQKSM